MVSASCVITFLFFLFLLPPLTSPNSLPCLSSCGKITNITHPFRLKQDPAHCGNHKYELDCVNNVTVLSLYDGYFRVESINYKNYTIRVVDPNIQPSNCSSLPRFLLSQNNFTYHSYYYQQNDSYQSFLNLYPYKSRDGIIRDYFKIHLSRPVTYMKCTSPPSKVMEKYYVDTASCLGQDTYAIVGDPPVEILDPKCRANLFTLTSFFRNSTAYAFYDYSIIGNISYIDIHKALQYGFEISWMQASCPCDECFFNEANEIQCVTCGFDSCDSNPFRLKQDPGHCGNNRYELDCVNNVTILNLYDGYFRVESINYNNYTIRVVDPNIQPTNCSSLPRFFLSLSNFTYHDIHNIDSYYYPYFPKENNSYQYFLNRKSYKFTDDPNPNYYLYAISRPVIYMKCTSPPSKVVEKYYADTASCLDQHMTYAIFGDPPFEIVEPQCRVKFITLTSFIWDSEAYTFYFNRFKANISYIDIHKALQYGFELSWMMQASCSCDECFLNEVDEIQCVILECGFDSCGKANSCINNFDIGNNLCQV